LFGIVRLFSPAPGRFDNRGQGRLSKKPPETEHAELHRKENSRNGRGAKNPEFIYLGRGFPETAGVTQRALVIG